jgi:hypothetical protein
MTRALRALALLGLLCAGCVARAPATADAAAFEAQGVFVRHARVRFAPAHTQAFEALLARCVRGARAAGLPGESGWLCYRETPGRYWVLWFSGSADGFPYPAAPDALAAFVRQTSGAADAAALARLDYELEWVLLLRQKLGWCTVPEMSTETHPKARLMERTIAPGAEGAFDRALTARTDFLRERGYPLPIEGFVTLAGAPGTAHQVLFPVDWASFHASTSIGTFVRVLDAEARAEYAARKRDLMVTMTRAEFYDADCLPELSYSGAR